MNPVSPIIPGGNLPEVVYAKDQPEYKPLPVFKDTDGVVLSRWKLSWWERFRVLLNGDIYLWVLTFNRPLQPVMLQTERPKMTNDEEAAAIGAFARKAEARTEGKSKLHLGDLGVPKTEANVF